VEHDLVHAPRAVPELVLPVVRAPIAVPELVVPEPEQREKPVRRGRWLLEWLVVLAAALVLAVTVRTFVAQMFYIPSGSMLPTLQIGDRIVVDKLSYHLHGIHRGDVVVFARPPLESAAYADLVKRVIGLPGDTISSIDGRVYLDGVPLDEPWLPNPRPVTSPSPLPDAFSLSHPYTVPAGEYYVMGDNRTDSEDSRYFGPIPEKLIVGKMAFKVWPLNDMVWLAALAVMAVGVLGLLVFMLRDRRSAHPGQAPTPRGPPGPGTPW
jgi:signal peptidase I